MAKFTKTDPEGEICIVQEDADSAPAIKGDVIGRVDDRGMLATAVAEWSDAALKTDVRPLVGSLEKLLSLRGVLYKWKNRGPESPDQMGLIAQEIEPYFPEVVVTDVDGLKSVRYSRLVAPLIEGFKELCVEIERLKQRIDNQEER